MGENGAEKAGNGVEVLGWWLGYPTTWPGAFSVLFVCSFVFSIAWLIQTKPEATQKALEAFGFSVVEVGAKGNVSTNARVSRVEFWTPSSKTKDWLGDSVVGAENTWQRLEDETQVDSFGKKLRGAQLGVLGFRRHGVVGHGNTQLKEGWWWTMRVDERFDSAAFAKFYREFWGSGSSSIFLERTASSADYLGASSTQ